jgi:hypothetical protein
MMAVIGATRKPAEPAARIGRGATATTSTIAREIAAVWDRESDGTAIHHAAYRPGKALERRLERVADIALGHDQSGDHGPEPLRETERGGEAKAARLDAVMRSACTAFGR